MSSKSIDKARVWVRGALAATFTGFGFALVWLSAVASEYLLSQSGGALAVSLLILGAILIGAAVWQFRLLVLKRDFSLRETLILSPLFVLLVLPISLASASYGEPLFVFSLTILLGLLPPAVSVAAEKVS